MFHQRILGRIVVETRTGCEYNNVYIIPPIIPWGVGGTVRIPQRELPPVPYLSARVRVAGVNTGRFIAVLNYGVSDAVVNGVATPFTTQTAKPSLCKVDGMYGGDINGTTSTVGFEAMTALKRDGTALIPAPLVPELKGKVHHESALAI